jgi:drug/metabolite transporter (DMT)-like permease
MNKALLQLHIAILLWGATGIIGNTISLNEAWLVWYRLAITAVSLTVLNVFHNEIHQITLKQKIQISISGSLQALHWICFFGAVKYANVSVALITLSATSFFTSILEPAINKTSLQTKEILLGLIAIVGIGFIFYADFEFKKGIGFGLASALLFSFVPIINKKQIKTVNAPTISIWSMTGGLLTVSVILPFYLRYFDEGNSIPNKNDWWLLLLLSWLCTIVTWRLALNALKKVSAFTQNLLLNLEPIYGITLAVIFGKEHKQFNFYFYCGIAIIILTVILQTIFINKQKESSISDGGK